MKANNQSRQPSALIITSLKVEYQAVCEHLSNIHEELLLHGTLCERGTFAATDHEWDITTLITSAGNASAAFETERAINYLQPEIVLFVGIAGGLKDVRIGDVVVATKIYSYEQDRADRDFPIRREVATTSYALIQRARACAKNEDWLLRTGALSTGDSQSSEGLSRVFIAPIVAGEKGIVAPSPLYGVLRSIYSDAVAVEMEGQGYGFLTAIQANQSVQMLVIRGITELLDDKSRADKSRALTAARHASAFAFQLLATLGKAQQAQSLHPSSATMYRNTAQTPSFPLAKDGAPEPIEIFFAYADEDEKFAQHLQKHLSLLKRAKVIASWHSGSTAGGEALSEQMQHVNKASIILLFISPDFLCSDYLFEIAERAMERQRTDGITITPILLRPTDGWHDTPFGNLQAIPKGDRPLTSFRNLDLAIDQVADEIRTVAEKVKVTRNPL